MDTTVERVNHAIARIELPLPFDDLHIVNAYAILGRSGVTLVDPGWSNGDSENALLAGLKALGKTREDVQQILVTHAHPDHFTLAASWQDRFDVPLLLGEHERPSVASFTPELSRFPRQADILERAGAPVLAQTIRELELLDYEREMAWSDPRRWLADRELVDCDGEVVEVIATPGHTRGHVVYRHVGSGALFTGDHVLPRITPSIGLELEPEGMPLANFLDSLELLLRLDDGTMLSAHGPVTSSVHDRVRELLTHHVERFATISLHVSEGMSTAARIAEAMTWTRHERSLAELHDVHRMTAIVEVLSHLDVLVERGSLQRSRVGATDHFELLASAA